MEWYRPSNNNAVCTRCGGGIANGTLCLREDFVEDGDDDLPWTYHPRCALDVSPYAVKGSLVRDAIAFEDREALAVLVEQRVAAMLQWSGERTATFRTKRLPKFPEIERARDPLGRPRVTLYVGGCFPRYDSAWEMDYADAIVVPVHITKREYVMVASPGYSTFPGDDDPSAPLVGAIYTSAVDNPLLPVELSRLAAWKEENLPMPVLWLVDSSNDQKAVDNRVLKLRRELNRLKYPGDDAVFVVSATVDAGALKEVLMAADSAIPDIAVRAIVAEKPGKKRKT